MSINIIPFENKFLKDVIDFVSEIYRNEFGLEFSLANQLDLLDINCCYKLGKGNFWCAFSAEGEMVGVSGLVDIGGESGAVRKLLVKEEFRGGFFYVAEKLLNNLETWACDKNIKCLYVGIPDNTTAISQFYKSRGFEEINFNSVLPSFPTTKEDNIFLIKKLLLNSEWRLGSV